MPLGAERKAEQPPGQEPAEGPRGGAGSTGQGRLACPGEGTAADRFLRIFITLFILSSADCQFGSNPCVLSKY